ncbi:MAG TPA: 2-C-methyl-D-erythritol 2,4-cyclodiphosphate synthase [Candidatus Dormibacteraeota bacterium]|nr:2-C-methyl-D-erythritol 2,4-cyclodiphosphate synthase [Candidatus Dormibacteraeota bacterium]
MAARAPSLRVGQGWDIHRLVPGRPLMLGGVRVPHRRGLLGHSDGDAVLHAVADALLGAVAAGDIGQHFPDTDPRWRDADSAALLAEVVRIVAGRGGRVVNVDVSILAEQPKLAPHMPAMRARLAALLGVGEACVGLKARTMEGLGAIGAGEAIAAQAVVLIDVKPRPAPRRSSGRPRRVKR